MSMTILTEAFRPSHPSAPLSRWLARWRAALHRRADRRALARGGRLGPRLLADMGIDPATAATRPGWDTLIPNGYLVHRRR